MTDRETSWLIATVMRYPIDWSPDVPFEVRDLIEKTEVGQVLVRRLVERMSGALLLAMEACADGREQEAVQRLITATHAREALLGLVEAIADGFEGTEE